MNTIRHSPGPAAAEAFALGTKTTVIGMLAAISGFVWFDVLTPAAAFAVLLIGLPLVYLLAACLLSVWLGYNKDAIDVVLS